jgi:NADH dehydrogenase
MTFRELVELIRRATKARALIVNVPAPMMRLAARALGLLVRDVVLTAEEIDGLMAGLLVSREPPLGEIALTRWLEKRGAAVGGRYANELQRHFASSA